MSYDIRIVNKDCETVQVTGCPIKTFGGTYACDENFNPIQMMSLEFNITYNYSLFYYENMNNDEGIRYLYGKNINQAIDIIEKTISKINKKYCSVYYKPLPRKSENVSDVIEHMKMEDDVLNDYWSPTPFNAVNSLKHILDCLYWMVSHYSEDDCNSFTFEGD